jgi:hypothetical protein
VYLSIFGYYLKVGYVGVTVYDKPHSTVVSLERAPMYIFSSGCDWSVAYLCTSVMRLQSVYCIDLVIIYDRRSVPFKMRYIYVKKRECVQIYDESEGCLHDERLCMSLQCEWERAVSMIYVRVCIL